MSVCLSAPKIVPKSATAVWSIGQHAGLQFVGPGLDAALGFAIILNILEFLRVIRNEVVIE